jgi:hypothetical protein
MATGHTVISREEIPVRRSVYEGGTVSCDWEHEGRKIRVTFRRNSSMRVHFPDVIVRVDGLRHSPTGWTNIELVPIASRPAAAM